LSILVYLGLFSLPVTLAALPGVASLEKGQRFFFIALSLEFALLVSACLAFQNAWMPLADNVLFDCGLGPLFTTAHSGPAPWPRAQPELWTAVTLAGAAGGGLLLSMVVVSLMRICRRWKTPEHSGRDRALVFLILAATSYIALIAVRGYFDRYLIFPLVPLVCVVGCGHAGAAWRGKRAAYALSLVLIVSSAAFALLATHDYLSWNRARWQALSYLTDDLKISPLSIDGGLEFNGWSAYEPKLGRSAVVFDTQMSHGDDYAVFFRPMDGYLPLRTFKFTRWLPFGQGEIFALKRRS